MWTRILVGWLALMGTGCTLATPVADDLVLDFTVLVQDAVQVSGIGVADDGAVALVTDFEQGFVVDPESLEARYTFSAQWGDLPRQGTTEGIAVRPDDTVVVLYPDLAAARVYEPSTGEILQEIPLAADDLNGAITLTPDGTGAYLVDGVDLLLVDLSDGSVTASTPLSGDLAGPVEGLSLDTDGGVQRLWLVDDASQVFELDPTTGVTAHRGTVAEVGDSSGLEAFVNPEDEAVLAITDDDDAYNAEPGPIRLYLSPPR